MEEREGGLSRYRSIREAGHENAGIVDANGR
jgi:hypothetical protein